MDPFLFSCSNYVLPFSPQYMQKGKVKFPIEDRLLVVFAQIFETGTKIAVSSLYAFLFNTFSHTCFFQNNFLINLIRNRQKSINRHY